MRKNREALEEFEPFMRNRSAIVKMIPIQDILVLLSSTGVCCTVSRGGTPNFMPFSRTISVSS
jgi:hypothetical protein